MTVMDGDPRTLVPDLFARLTVLERRQSVKSFGVRVGMDRQGKLRYPDDEAPDSVARKALVRGLFTTGLLLTGVPLWAFGVCLGIVLGGTSGWWAVGAVGLGSYVLVIVTLCLVRLQQINRFFAKRAPGASHSRTIGS